MDSHSGGGNKKNNNDIVPWGITIILLMTPLWPVGLVLLFRKLMWGPSGKAAGQTRHPYNPAQEAGRGAVRPGTQGMEGTRARGGAQKERRERARHTASVGKVNLSRGKGLTIGGLSIAALFGFSAITSILDIVGTGGAFLPELAGIFTLLGFLCAGLVMAYAGHQRTQKSRRYRKYLALIGKRKEIAITALAQAMPVSVHTACEDLQDMLDDGMLHAGYLDMGSGYLILSDEGLRDAPAPEPEEASAATGDDAMLGEIRAVNDAIDDPEMSRKIDRIGEITGKILTYQRQNPGKDAQLRSFLSYYLPTTLKILKAYARMEAQGIEGENIMAAKGRIEGMMDQVVEGFEKQLDRLFQNDAMDITTDVEVLERMLEKDGLSGGQGFTLDMGGCKSQAKEEGMCS